MYLLMSMVYVFFLGIRIREISLDGMVWYGMYGLFCLL
jgi:hypothetical protein